MWLTYDIRLGTFRKRKEEKFQTANVVGCGAVGQLLSLQMDGCIIMLYISKNLIGKPFGVWIIA